MFRSSYSDEYETYTPEANELDRKVAAVLNPIVTKAVEDGVSLRDLESVLICAVTLEISGGVVFRNAKIAKAKRQALGNEAGHAPIV